jgi:TPP-dependent indolepyruvate ferredoxin oxidoreductase alpha subunit
MKVKEALKTIKEMRAYKLLLQSQLPKKYSDEFWTATEKIKKLEDRAQTLEECVLNYELDDSLNARFHQEEEFWIKN